MTEPGRLGRAFARARSEHRGAFIPFLTSGFPDPAESDRLASALCEEGVDALELGVPFSDPIADGPTIQRTTEVALRAGVTLTSVLGQAARLRERHPTPLVLMTYLNPVLRYGAGRFASDAAAAGVDGLVLVDLPPDEEPELWGSVREAGLDTIVLVAPTTGAERLARIVPGAGGFLYVVARLGVTGRGASDPAVDSVLERCRGLSELPRCLGFGIDLTTPIERYRGRAEGIVVGSALLDSILGAPSPRAREETARRLARSFLSKLETLDPA